MPSILLALLPLLGRIAPDLVGLAFGGQASAVATKVEAAVRDIFGTTDPAAIDQQTTADPSKVDTLKDRLDAETEQLKAQLADVADARAMELGLAQAHSWMAYGAPLVSAIATAGFVLAAYMVLAHPNEPSAAANQVLGAMIVGWTTVLTYWLGSSKGSADKTASLVSIAHTATAVATKRGR